MDREKQKTVIYTFITDKNKNKRAPFFSFVHSYDVSSPFKRKKKKIHTNKSKSNKKRLKEQNVLQSKKKNK